jgi:hypothetical protein
MSEPVAPLHVGTNEQLRETLIKRMTELIDKRLAEKFDIILLPGDSVDARWDIDLSFRLLYGPDGKVTLTTLPLEAKKRCPFVCEETVGDLLKRAQAAEDNLEFYKRRESYFVQKLRVADAGQYRADWDSPLELVRCILNVVRELQFQPCTCFTHQGEKQTCIWCRLRTALEALDRRGL